MLVEIGGRLLKAFGGEALEGLVDLVLSHFDLLFLGFLDLQRFVDQVAQDLQPQVLQFLIGNLGILIGCEDKGDPLVDIGPGDDLPIHLRRGVAAVGVHLAEQLDVGGNVQAAVGRVVLPLACILGDSQAGRERARAGQRGGTSQSPNSPCGSAHVVVPPAAHGAPVILGQPVAGIG